MGRARDTSRIPKMPTITVPPLDEVQKPAFEYRDVYIGEAFDKDWAARNKTNGTDTHLDASTGGKVVRLAHSFYSLIPPAEYFKSHPEYFSLVGGKRRGEDAKLCLTNPDMLRIATEHVLRWMKEYPEATIFQIQPNDVGGWCEFDNCKRVTREEGGAGSGLLLRFINAIAKQAEKVYPDKSIETLAYAYTEAPPAKTRPRHNVHICMCPIGACQAHPYEKCRYDTYIMNHLRGWAKITDSGDLYVWHYNANYSHYLLPVPDFDELAADLPMYKRNCVVGLFMQGSVPEGGSDAPLRAYVLARLLWDVNANVPKAIREFHEIYYGRAAAPMLAYFRLVQNLVRFPPEGEGQHWWCCRSPRFGDATLDKARRLLA